MKRLMAIMAAAVTTMIGASAHAQPLADRLPGDAQLYIGWAGANSVGGEFEQTHLKAVLAESRVRELFGTYVDQLQAQLAKRDVRLGDQVRIGRAISEPFWKYPTAIAVSVTSPQGQPVVNAVLGVQSGAANAPAIADEWTKLLKGAPEGANTPHVTIKDDVVYLTIGTHSDDWLGTAGTQPLTKAATLAGALPKMNAKPMIVTHVNLDAVRPLIKTPANATEQAVRVINATNVFLEESGLNNVHGVTYTAGFDGADWMTHALVSAPAPRTGVLAAWSDEPASEALLQAVPADAVFFAGARFDAAKFIKQTQAALGKADADGLKYFNMGLGAMQQALGTNVLENILEPLGQDWALYNAPRVGTAGFLGTVLVNTPDDPDKLKRALNTASVSIANWLSVGLSKGGGAASTMSVRAQRIKIGSADVTYLATPIISPAWTIADGRLYAGLYPQVVGAAARQAAKGGPSLATSPKYQAVLKRLGVEKPASATFFDLPTSASYGQMYSTILMISRYAGFADLFAAPIPEPLIPPVDVMLDHLAPAGKVTWADADGWHSKSVSSFPGATFLTEQGFVSGGGVAMGGLGAAILMPSLNRARESANRVQSASNLRQIGQGLLIYANENGGKYPDDFKSLLTMPDLITPDIMINPRTDNQLPDDDAAARIEYAATDGDYVYIGKGLNNAAPATTIVAYEKPESVTDGINVLFGDGHVEFLAMDHALAQIDMQKRERGIE